MPIPLIRLLNVVMPFQQDCVCARICQKTPHDGEVEVQEEQKLHINSQGRHFVSWRRLCDLQIIFGLALYLPLLLFLLPSTQASPRFLPAAFRAKGIDFFIYPQLKGTQIRDRP